MTKYIFFVPDELALYLFADIKFDADFDLVRLKRSLLGKILISGKSPVAKIIKKLKLADFFTNKFFCYNFGKFKKFYSDKNYVLVFVAGAASILPEKMLQDFSKKKNISLALLLMDSFHASSPTAVKLRNLCFEKNWQKVYTFDKNDAQEFGFKNIGLCYYSTSRLPVQNSSKTKSDVFFVGGLKGNRENLILSLFEECEKHNLKADFVLSCINKNQWKNRKFSKKIKYIKKWISYSKVLKKVSSTNCIIEILQKNQESQTVRYFESLVFNKKLLTNNPNIVSLPFYDSRFMKYFENINDVDFEWLKKKENISYGYNNEFSAIHLAQLIKADFENLWGGDDCRVVCVPSAITMRRAS